MNDIIKYFNNKKYKKLSKYDNKRIFKILFIIIIIIILIIFYSEAKDLILSGEINLMNNNRWFKKNLTEFINNYLFVFNGSYNEIVKRDIFYKKIFFFNIIR